MGPNYNPVPPRVWSRVQDDRPQQADQMLLKGNVLQYKKNGSSLTKSQKYSKIAKGQWISRNKSYATKTQTYTNPNTNSLQRVNFATIPFPNNIVGSPNNSSGSFQTNVPNPFNCPTTALQDGGSLIGNVQVLKCDNGTIVKTTRNNPYNSTTCSDVPGKPKVLYWDSTVETWYPRTRYVMPTSGTKWPEGYKGLVCAITPNPPTKLTSFTNESKCPLVAWSYDNCPPVTSFRVYLNGGFYKTVTDPYMVFTDLAIGQMYQVTVTSIVADKESSQSLHTSVTGPTLLPPYNLIQSSDNCSVTVYWSQYTCPAVTSYDVYLDASATTVSVPYKTFENLVPSQIYTVQVRSFSGSNSSALSVSISITGPPILPPYDLTQTTVVGLLTVCWSHNNCPAVAEYDVYLDGVQYGTVTNSCITFDDLVPDQSYTISVVSVSLYGDISSSDSEDLNITGPSLIPPILVLDDPDTPGTIQISWTNNEYPSVAKYLVDVTNNGSIETTNKSITFYDLIPDQSYTITVKSVSLYGPVSDPSKPRDVTGPPLIPPTLSDPPTYQNGVATVSWTNTDIRVTGYEIWINGKFNKTITDKFIKLTDLIILQSYSLGVKSTYAGKKSEFSNTIAILLPLTPPALKIEEPIAENVVHLSWLSDHYPETTQYTVYKNNVYQTSTQSDHYTFSNLAPGQYNFTVKAVINGQFSEYSNVVTANITYIYPPMHLTSTIDNGLVKLTWDSYPIEYNISKFKVTYTTNETKHTKEIVPNNFSIGVENDTEYVFDVVAVTKTGLESQISSTSRSASDGILYVTYGPFNYHRDLEKCIVLENAAKSNDPYVSSNGESCTIKLTLKGNYDIVCSILVIGGGAGGGSGSNTYNTGGGGGGGGITYLQGIKFSPEDEIEMTIGYAGQGRQKQGQGNGNCTGGSGGDSSVTIKGKTYLSQGGGPGRGIGAVDTNGFNGGGGKGGDASYGGGGGGGCRSDKGGPQAPGSGGSSSGKNGIKGSKDTGGGGGTSGLNSIIIKGNIFYLSGGGGAGNIGGGYAGKGLGGLLGSTTTSQRPSGEDAITGLNAGNYYYGGGGGGGGGYSGSTQYGGDGGKGAVIIWWD